MDTDAEREWVQEDKGGWMAGWLASQPPERGVLLTVYKTWKYRDTMLQADAEYVALTALPPPSITNEEWWDAHHD